MNDRDIDRQPYGPQLPTAADVQAAADVAAMFTWMPEAVPAIGTQAAADRLAQTERAFALAQPEPEAEREIEDPEAEIG
jgi:hypothetical protein